MIDRRYTKIQFTVEEGGRVYTRTVEGAEADKWQEYMLKVCEVASKSDIYPDFKSLNWIEEEVPRSVIDELLSIREQNEREGK